MPHHTARITEQIKCLLTRADEAPVRDTRAQSTTQKKKTITIRSLLQSRGISLGDSEHFGDTRSNTRFVRHAIPKSVFLVIRSAAESLELHRYRSDSELVRRRHVRYFLERPDDKRRLRFFFFFFPYPSFLSFPLSSFRGSTGAPEPLRTLSFALVRMTSRRENETRPSRLLT